MERMKISRLLTKSRNDASGVEPRGLVVEATVVTQAGPEFASKAALHQEVDELLVLEGAMHSGTKIKKNFIQSKTFAFRENCQRVEALKITKSHFCWEQLSAANVNGCSIFKMLPADQHCTAESIK